MSPVTRRRGPRRNAIRVSGLIKFRLQLGPSTPPMPPPEPGAWVTREDRAAWLAVAAELPPEEWPRWEMFWASAPGIPDELRLLPGLQALGVDQGARRRAWLRDQPAVRRP